VVRTARTWAWFLFGGVRVRRADALLEMRPLPRV
jgi:hypothetical protein